MKFVSTEASLYNGISQQSPELRLPSQTTDSINTNLTLARGLEMRPPAERIIEEIGEWSTDTLCHPQSENSNLTNLFLIGGVGSTLDHKVQDTAGVSYPIFYQDTDARNYLETPNADGDFVPIDCLQLSSVLDYTFVSNKYVIAAMDATSGVAVPDTVGYLWVRNGVQQVSRTIILDGVSYTVGKSGDNDSKAIVDAFLSLIPAGFTGTVISNAVLKIIKNDNSPFTFTATDSYSDTTMAAVLSNGLKNEDLPPVVDPDQIMTIIPEKSEEATYFLKYDAGTKTYYEVSAPGEPSALDPKTLPHAFIRRHDVSGAVTGTADSYYYNLERLAYVERLSGSNESSPLPSFVGKTIADVFFFKNRLGFLSEDSVILSGVDDLFRFFPISIQSVLDDDPIDVTASSTSRVKLQHVASFPENLILKGNNQQFTLGSGGKTFTSENVLLDPTTSYSSDPIVPPISVGSTMYFVAPQSSYSAIREYSVQPDTLVTDAADITAHVPRLIPNNLKQIISENNLEYLFLVDTSDYVDSENVLWVYKFYWQGNEKVQSAWKKWTLWFNPIGGTTVDGKLFLIGTEKVAGVPYTVMVSFNLSDRAPVIVDVESGKPYKSTRPFIDRQVTNNSIPIVSPGVIILEVDAYTYNYPDIDGATITVVDRVTGIRYSLINQYTDGGLYYLVLGDPDYLLGVDLPFDDTILGSYTSGGVPLDTP